MGVRRLAASTASVFHHCQALHEIARHLRGAEQSETAGGFVVHAQGRGPSRAGRRDGCEQSFERYAQVRRLGRGVHRQLGRRVIDGNALRHASPVVSVRPGLWTA